MEPDGKAVVRRKPRILYLLPGPIPPHPDPRTSKYFHISDVACGEVLLPIWLNTPEQVEAHLGEGSYPTFQEGSFRYHFRLAPPGESKVYQMIRRLRFYIREGRRLHKEEPVDIVMSYGTSLTGLGALILKYFTGAKLIIEVPGAPQSMSTYDMPVPSKALLRRQAIYEKLFVFILKRADHAKLLYPTQLSAFPALDDVPTSVFHNLVPASLIEPGPEEADKTIVFVGTPWYRKAVDVLIKSFLSIVDEFPDYKLRLIGHVPSTGYLKELTQGDERIVFEGPLPPPVTYEAIRHCTVFVCPSRSEAMGRVNLEAMAAKRPIVATAVDGIPYYVEDGFNGLLVEPDNVEELAEALAHVLRDPELARTLGQNAYDRLHEELDEKAFCRSFGKLVSDVLGPDAPA